MSQSKETPSIEDVKSAMLDANGALDDEDFKNAFEKLKKAKRRCGVLMREEGENGQ